MRKPIIFFKGNVVMRPGDPVCLRGEDLDTVNKIVLSDGVKTVEPELFQRDVHSLKFIIPADFEKTAYSCKLVYDGGEDMTVINEPLVRWIQGNEGATATPGGWLRVIGENISVFGKKVIGTLNGVELTDVKVFDAYCVEFKIPADAKYGKYSFTYSNGFVTAPSLEFEIAPSPREAWPKDVFNITDFGAVNGQNSTDAIKAALKAAEKNGGGVVYIPTGIWPVKSNFEIPAKTAIKGAGIKKTSVVWDGYTWEIGQLPDYMLKGSTDFAIEDLTFGATRIGNFIVNDYSGGVCKNIYIQRLRLHANPCAGTRAHRIEGGIERQRDIIEETMSFNTDLFRFNNAENVQILDNYFLCGGRPMGGGSKKYLLMQNNTLDGTATYDNWMPVGYCVYCIMEDNWFNGYTIGTSGPFFYFARNRITEVLDNNRESFTTDMQGGTPYHGSAKKISDTKYLFPFESNVAALKKGQDGIGLVKAVYIIRGRGMGQYRTIKDFDGDMIEINEPFTVEPDETSEMTVNSYEDAWYMVNNTVHDGGDFQFFVPQLNTVVDGLKMSYARGLVGWGGFIYDGWCLQWYISFVNCDFSDGNYYHMESCDRCRLTVMGRYDEGPSTLANLIRDNKCRENCNLNVQSSSNPESVTDIMIYNNDVAEVDTALNIVGKTLRAYIADNKFADVDTAIATNLDDQIEAIIK